MKNPIAKTALALTFVFWLQNGIAVDAPAWSLADGDGKQVNLADFKGNPVIIHFWATWCPYCKKLQPGLERLYQKYSSKGLQLIAISAWEDKDANPAETLKKRGHSFKTLIEGDLVAKRYGVRGTPTTFFIDAHGQIAHVTFGSNPNDPVLEKTVQQLIK